MQYSKTAILYLLLTAALSMAQLPLTSSAILAESVRISSYSEMMITLREIAASSGRTQLRIIGKTAAGREIPALFFPAEDEISPWPRKLPLVLIYCQQHGNEPAGKEAALLLMKEIAARKAVSQYHFDLIIVPVVNPDGVEIASRRNANEVDLNRDYAALTQPESQALHDLFLDYLPEVTLDVHEYNAVVKDWVDYGIIKDADIMFDGVTNLNIASGIIEFSFNTVIPALGEALTAQGLRFERYILGSPDENDIIRHSTTEINDARHSMGIYNTLSFIMEGKKYTGSVSYLDRRVQNQLKSMRAFLDIIEANKKNILDITLQSRQDLLTNNHSGDEPIYLQFKRLPAAADEPLTYPVFDLYAWKPRTRTFSNYRPGLQPKIEAAKPYAYIIPGGYTELFALLQRHRIQMFKLAGKSDLPLEIYHITGITPDEDEPSGSKLKITIFQEIRRLDEGAVVIYLQQPAALLIPLLLEPQSSNRLIMDLNSAVIKTPALKNRGEYPVYRLMEDVELGLLPF